MADGVATEGQNLGAVVAVDNQSNPHPASTAAVDTEQTVGSEGTTAEQPEPGQEGAAVVGMDVDAGTDQAITGLPRVDIPELNPTEISLLLAQVAGKRAEAFVKQRINIITTAMQEGKLSHKQGAAELQVLRLQEAIAKGQAEQMDNKVQELKKNDNPDMKALGYDIDLAFEQMELSELQHGYSNLEQTIKLQLQQAGKSETEIQVALDKNEKLKFIKETISQQEQKITSMNAERATITKDGTPIENKVVQSTLAFAQKVGVELTPERIQQIQDNPIGYFDGMLGRVIGNKDKAVQFTNQLVEHGMIPKNHQKELLNVLSLENSEGKAKQLLKLSALISLLFGFLIKKIMDSEANPQGR